MSNYISSIVSRYGDVNSVKVDSQVITEIISRQGSGLLLDVISESCGNTANKFNLSNEDRNRLIESLVEEFKMSLQERL